jgi:transposase
MDGTKSQSEFGTIFPELIGFKEWLIGNGCNLVAVDQLIYWIPIYSVLDDIDVIAANPYIIKYITGKTCMTDSE